MVSDIGHGLVVEPDQTHVGQARIADDDEVARLPERHDSSFRVLSESMGPKRILVADDSDTSRRVLRPYLGLQDLDVCGEVADGEDAIE
jgi:PleD family two-component response regulator